MKLKINTDLGMLGQIPSDAVYRSMYGEHAVITRLGKISIIHLDDPSESMIHHSQLLLAGILGLCGHLVPRLALHV